jgi:hypothetical protein
MLLRGTTLAPHCLPEGRVAVQVSDEAISKLEEIASRKIGSQ